MSNEFDESRLDPEPWAQGLARYPYPGWLNGRRLDFAPRPGYSQNREDYA